jgi:hypothetical protein
MSDYSTQIQQIINNQKFLMSGINTVYQSVPLNNLYNSVLNTEYDKIMRYDAGKQNTNIQKHLNLAKLYNDENEVLSVNNKLMNNNDEVYNSDFNENIIKIDKLNDIISTKNKIIQINEYEQTKKDRLIFIMTRIILFLVLMIVPVILMAMGYISLIIGILFIVLCAIITVIVVFFQMKKNQDGDIINIINKTKETAKDFARTVIKDIFPKSFVKSCPDRTNPKNTVTYNYNTGNEVWLDNSNNQWEEGDIPTIGGTKQGYLALGDKAEPMPYYGGNPETPKYTCKWKYDPSKMTNMNNGTKFTTTIPCEFYPGYETVNNV